ncbi:hypothetical protein [Delftia acidovorans]|uniref:hypothetical protein n=1 Tax=Delftia acidovorans TaxID=80866 RepID=UPI0035A0A389
MKRLSKPDTLSDYEIDISTGRVVKKSKNTTPPPKSDSIADFLNSDSATRKKIYLKALKQSEIDQQSIIKKAERLKKNKE